MKIQNIVFNRLGNNLSILIDYNQRQIQIWDEVYFTIKDRYVEISSICIDKDFMKIRMDIYFREDRDYIDFLFEKEKVYIKNLGEFEPDDEGFSGSVQETEILFKIGMNTELRNLIRGEKIFIPQQDFFKNVALIFMS
ncbi:hypothetical protein SAMN06265182_0515 [Persephonella hydrogeniphila]|uniref:Uncharacterized protein n=1 Tax=Persephonella hydrogeniphila TaxID=198703 RepID=A0A285N4T5_9AQUI|nr:hypothetical protein [Persephonella hydrogeniphila]SNZ03953.1 hypothetical protein SAMN06265182_0515 [Persephonella hydrogeniphila]